MSVSITFDIHSQRDRGLLRSLLDQIDATAMGDEGVEEVRAVLATVSSDLSLSVFDAAVCRTEPYTLQDLADELAVPKESVRGAWMNLGASLRHRKLVAPWERMNRASPYVYRNRA